MPYLEVVGLHELVEEDHPVAVPVDLAEVLVELLLLVLQVEVVREVHGDALLQVGAPVHLADVAVHLLQH